MHSGVMGLGLSVRVLAERPKVLTPAARLLQFSGQEVSLSGYHLGLGLVDLLGGCCMPWLEQRQPGEGGELLQDYPGKVVRIECRYCDRTGRYGLAWMVRRFGPAAALPEVLAALSDDCPRRQDWRHTGPCGAGFPELSARLRG